MHTRIRRNSSFSSQAWIFLSWVAMTVCLTLQIVNLLQLCFGYLAAVHGLEQLEKTVLGLTFPLHLCLLV